jgi:2',3'-cyclic-nucleotide 2'-phosphodiesterase (5'-nucleotidase family)
MSAATASAGALTQKILPVLSTSDAAGKVLPCGCSVPKGGLARLASVIDSTKIKYGDALVVDAGDLAPELLGPRDDARLAYQIGELGRIGYDALGVGERELAFGGERLKTLAAAAKLPLLSANLVDRKTGKPAFAPSVVVRKGGMRIGVFAVLGRGIELPAAARERYTVEDPVLASLRTIAALRPQCDVIVALAHLGNLEGQQLAADVPGMDVVILAHHAGTVTNGALSQGTITIASGEQIENVGLTRLTLDGRKVRAATSESVALLPEVGERNDVAVRVRVFEEGQAGK